MEANLFDQDEGKEPQGPPKYLHSFRDFEYRCKFQDDVHGRILLNSVECQVVDTPEFQRLFRVAQMGFADFVFPTANHTRGVHSIGVCHLAGQLMDRLEQNHRITRNAGLQRLPVPPFSKCDRVLIRLGGLLHDLSHGAFSHDMEKKKHLVYAVSDADKEPRSYWVRSHYGAYDKHDDYEHNPILYTLLFDQSFSVLARVLHAYSPQFWRLMAHEARILKTEEPNERRFPLIAGFVSAITTAGLADLEDWILPQLLFHLLMHEGPGNCSVKSVSPGFTDDGTPKPAEPWGLGSKPEHWQALHDAWYQPYRHDIIGNTLSADLLDYLYRDPQRMGLEHVFDTNILNFYVLAPTKTGKTYCCALDLEDFKRGVLRRDVLNDIFRLLDLRHEIHEKGVMHRIIQSSNAMLSRTLLLLSEARARPGLEEMFGISDNCVALAGDEYFLRSLRDRTRTLPITDSPRADEEIQYLLDARHVLDKLCERRLYRPLMVIPGDRVHLILADQNIAMPSEARDDHVARRIAAIVDSPMFAPFFLFISHCVEQFLEHSCRGKELLDTIASIPKDPKRVDAAMRCVPRGVIIWTTPYKQLYKDPALTVFVRGELYQLDKLPGRGGSPDVRSVAEHVNHAIQYANSKYAGMWNVYVLISDGLFYTGTAPKFMEQHPCKGPASDFARHPHLECLKEAERLLVVAFGTAYEYWVGQWEDESFKNPDNSPLHNRMDCDKFRELLELYVLRLQMDLRRGREIGPRISAVRIEEYLHGDPEVGPDHRDRCRDIRYKFDRPVKLDHCELRETRSDRQACAALARLLRRCGASERALTEAEFRKLALLYAIPSIRQQCDQLELQIADKAPGAAAARAARGDSGEMLEGLRRVFWHRGPLWESHDGSK